MPDHLPDAWRALNGTQRDILVVLAFESPATGAEINRALDRAYENRSGVHKNLDTLRERGLVTAVDAADTPGRAKRNHLTSDGEALLEAVCDTFHYVGLAIAP